MKYIVKDTIFSNYSSADKYAEKINYPVIYCRETEEEINDVLKRNLKEDKEIKKTITK